jgi:hypothetical protein
MNKTRLILFFIALILYLDNSIAQKLDLLCNPVNNLFNTNNQHNDIEYIFPSLSLYRMNQNPADLLLSDKKTSMLIAYNFNKEEGSYRKVFEEEQKMLNNSVIDIIFRMDTSQALHSSISFFENYSTTKYYSENRFPYRGNPFLIADDNPGDFRQDMLCLETDYVKKLFNNLDLGVQISYNVGEGLKKYFPKPTSDYRDIGARLGFTYQIDENNPVSIFGDYFNLFEEITFDDNARSPKIYRFRGLDYPIILTALTGATRQYKDEGFGGGFEYQHIFNSNFNIIFSARAFQDKEIVIDGISSPTDDGRWKEKNYEIKLTGVYTGNDISLRSGLLYEYNYQNALKGTRDEITLNRKNYIISPFIGIGYKLNNDLNIHFLYQMFIAGQKTNDYINYIYYSIPYINYSPEISANYKFSENLSLSLLYRINLYEPEIKDIETIAPGEIYFKFFDPDIKLLQEKYTSHFIRTMLTYHYGLFGDFGFVAHFGRIVSDDTKYRNNINFSVFLNLFIF